MLRGAYLAKLIKLIQQTQFFSHNVTYTVLEMLLYPEKSAKLVKRLTFIIDFH